MRCWARAWWSRRKYSCPTCFRATRLSIMRCGRITSRRRRAGRLAGLHNGHYAKVLSIGPNAQPTLQPTSAERKLEEPNHRLFYPCVSCFRFYRLCVPGTSRTPDTNPHANFDARSHSNACTHSRLYANVCTDAHAGRTAYCHSYIHAGDRANARCPASSFSG